MKESHSKLDNKDALQIFLGGKGIRATNLELLSGGYTSTVFRMQVDGQPIIAKHARFRERFYPTHQVVPETRMSTEVEVLTRLQPVFSQIIPRVLAYYPEDNVMLMTDVGQDAQLGFPYFLEGNAKPIHAHALGRFLAELKQATADWQPFPTVEDPFEQIWTRGLEVDIANPTWGQRMREMYLTPKKFVWPDGHPKNVFFSNFTPSVRAIDFDCCHFGDPDYMLPNFFGQIPIFFIFDYISPSQATIFVSEMIRGYIEVEPVNPEIEKKMVFYAGAQTIQRQDGKWLFGACGGTDDESLRRKAQIFYFGRKVIGSIDNFADYLQLLQKS